MVLVVVGKDLKNLHILEIPVGCLEKYLQEIIRIRFCLWRQCTYWTASFFCCCVIVWVEGKAEKDNDESLFYKFGAFCLILVCLVGCLSFTAYQPLWVIQCQIRFTYMNYIWFVTIIFNSLFFHKLTFLLNLCFDPFDPQAPSLRVRVDPLQVVIVEIYGFAWGYLTKLFLYWVDW